MTQQAVAARLRKTTSAIQKWEAGSTSPTMEDIARLAEAYHIRPAAFFADDNILTTALDENVVVFLDGFDTLTDSKRNRIISRLRECARALIAVPDEFADHWFAGLTACADIVANDSRCGQQKSIRRQSAKSVVTKTKGANVSAKVSARRVPK
jgi:transcriptional regulator with XRE-family HTH domain